MDNVPHRVQWEHLDRAEHWTPWSEGLRENLAAAAPPPVVPRAESSVQPGSAPIPEGPAGRSTRSVSELRNIPPGGIC